MSSPFLAIEKNESGESFISVDSSRSEAKFPLSLAGAKEVGRHLRSIGASNWLVSSTLDIPGEYGADFGANELFELINEGWNIGDGS